MASKIIFMNVAEVYPHCSTYALVCLAQEDTLNRKVVSDVLELEDIMLEICSILGIERGLVYKKNRERNIVACRKIFCFIANSTNRFKLREIAMFAGVGDHATVIYHVNDVIDKLKVGDSYFLRYWQKYIRKTNIYIPYKVVCEN